MLWRDKSENLNEGDLFVHQLVAVVIIFKYMSIQYIILKEE
jgi:hypothetical protein